ncbi:MAG: TlpA disulfide reductase family protein [Steroidobacteraceae bacterium]
MAVVAGWGGALAFSWLHPEPLAAAPGFPPPDSAAPVEAPRAGVQASPGIPERLPDFSLADLAGTSTPVTRWQGHPLMLNFWATWCAPCRREIPLLQSLHRERAASGLTVIGIAVDFPDKVLKFRDEMRIGYPLLAGEQDALDLIAKLGVASPAFPFTVFTDRQGRIVTLYLGELKRPVAEAILATVSQVDQGSIALPAARERIAAEVRKLRGE